MEKTVGMGHQDFEVIRQERCFYIDKTLFLKEWWQGKDAVTLITRPRRFGKTLNMTMAEKFFSVRYAGREDLFQGLKVWEDQEFRKLQGSYPVLFISFAGVKENSYLQTRKKICSIIKEIYNQHCFLLDGDWLNPDEKLDFQDISADMEDYKASGSLKALSGYLSRYYRKRIIILLDEYDTPMQEAYVNGFWDEMVSFTRNLFNSTFKSNPYLERAIMTGITRISRESVFSDLNNLEVVTTTSDKYADCFGFTEEEVFEALEEFGFSHRRQEVKNWYDGFSFGSRRDIYNPWSVLNFLDKGKVAAYWANSSSNALAGKLIREGSRELKASFESLLRGEGITAEIDEQVVYGQLNDDGQAVWSLLLASGYLKVKDLKTFMSGSGEWAQEYRLELTNFEVRTMFRNIVRRWFAGVVSDYNDFVRALLLGDVDAMNEYMNHVAEFTFSSFDTGRQPSKAEPERFYHGFVLGLMVELSGRYILSSNKESGFGRYDVMLEPLSPKQDDGIILEFKVFQPRKEKKLEDTVQAALRQIEEKGYGTALAARGIPLERIRKYGFAFQGKKVLIGN
ncbi:hypothetical protein IMSAGC019_02727 [Lachnospiraceae bacterium]|nr:hypothetical protein IMSAGC019_02727 [Lachnospiraceae bacterium]